MMDTVIFNFKFEDKTMKQEKTSIRKKIAKIELIVSLVGMIALVIWLFI